MVADRRAILVGPLKDTGRRDEREAAEAITPGHLVELTSADKVQKQATAAAKAEAAFAVEDSMQGKDYTEDYSTGDRVQFHLLKKGQEVWAILKDGESVVIGDRIEPAGGGEVQKSSTTSAGALVNAAAQLAIALEAIDASGSAATPVADRRIIIRIV